MINENKIRCFLCLAETLNFTETAKRMFMTQQGVSKNIANIEDKLKFPLFVRSSRSVSLTPEGKRCYDLFSSFMKNYDAFVADGRKKQNNESQMIWVGYQNWLDFGDIPIHAQDDMLKAFPAFRMAAVRYSPGLLRQHFDTRELDIILIHRRFAPSGPGLKKLCLMRVRMQLMVASSNPLATPDATYQTFANSPFIIDAFEGESETETRSRAAHECQMYGLTPSEIIVVPNRDSVYTAAQIGQGIIVATSMSRWQKGLVCYPTDAEEELLCVWREADPTGLLDRYAAALQDEYQKSRPHHYLPPDLSEKQ